MLPQKYGFLAHIGGFVMGLLVSTVFYPVISVTRRHRLVMWCFRLAAIPLAVILYVLLVRNFYTSDPYAGMCLHFLDVRSMTHLFQACAGCRYLSCIPSSVNNHCQGYVPLFFRKQIFNWSSSSLSQNWFVMSFFSPRHCVTVDLDHRTHIIVEYEYMTMTINKTFCHSLLHPLYMNIGRYRRAP